MRSPYEGAKLQQYRIKIRHTWVQKFYPVLGWFGGRPLNFVSRLQFYVLDKFQSAIYDFFDSFWTCWASLGGRPCETKPCGSVLRSKATIGKNCPESQILHWRCQPHFPHFPRFGVRIFRRVFLKPLFFSGVRGGLAHFPFFPFIGFESLISKM